MASHYCLDPNDTLLLSRVLVVFEGGYPDIKLMSVTNRHKDDILPRLMVEQRRDLKREIAAFYRSPSNAAEALPHQMANDEPPP